MSDCAPGEGVLRMHGRAPSTSPRSVHRAQQALPAGIRGRTFGVQSAAVAPSFARISAAISASGRWSATAPRPSRNGCIACTCMAAAVICVLQDTA